MDGLIAFLRSRATLRNALVVLALFGLNAFVLALLDQPLLERAAGEPKLDLRFGYDLATVHRLLEAYGEDGRRMYGWNLLADTPFPILGSFGVGLLALVAFSDPQWQRILLVPPLVFAVTDVVENVLLFSITQGFPAIAPLLVMVSSMITQVKRTAFYTGALELVLSVVVIAMLHHTRK